jgi:hypothetical protein
MKAKAAALDFTKHFFLGDVSTDPTGFDGLQTRLTGDQVIEGVGNLTLGLLDQLIDCVFGRPDVLFMNKATRRLVNTLMRGAGQATETISDVFGRQIDAYAGIPICIIEEDATGQEILPSDIYAVRMGAGEYVGGLQAAPIETIDQGLQGIFFQTLVEWVVSFALFHPRAAARLTDLI